jgi:hypothetical protein
MRNEMDQIDDTGKELARWLQEAARRKRLATRGENKRAADKGRHDLPIGGPLARIKWLIVLAAIAYAQFDYVGAWLEISSIRSIIVFVLVNGQLPPV